MKIPYSTIKASLAVAPHMYIYLDETNDKRRFLTCQSLKPYHLGKNKLPYKRVIEDPNLQRNPFLKKTLIDCDKTFVIENAEISRDLLTNSRKDICQSLYNQVNDTSNHSELVEHPINARTLSELNYKIKIKN